MKNKRIRMVTFTGADDSILPENLGPFCAQHPRVEFGILFSETKIGTERYPSERWVKELFYSQGYGKYAAHICGSMSRRLLQGTDIVDQFPILMFFDRIQVNFTLDKIDGCRPEELALIIHRWPRIRFIIQLHGNNSRLLKVLDSYRCEYDILNDESGGKGKVGGCPFVQCHAINVGYAGGINPENVLERCEVFSTNTDRGHFNIDMESGVRENADGTGGFSLEKCEAVCQALEI